MLYRIGNAPVNPFPYPHIFVRDVFPADYYAELQRNLPPRDALVPLGEARNTVAGNYSPRRSVLLLNEESIGRLEEPFRSFWKRVGKMLVAASLGPMLVDKFGQILDSRFSGQTNLAISDEALLVQDYAGYSLGPHTDSPSKVFSLLFYLPADDARPYLGTSIYMPKDSGFSCPGGPHHAFDRFERVLTMPYVPNAAFGFVKTPNAFHGVEPMAEADGHRTLLLYDIRVHAQPVTRTAAAPTAQFKF